MKASFNYTDRKTIHHIGDTSHITVSLDEAISDPWEVKVAFLPEFDNLDLPHDSKIYVEAWIREIRLREYCGTVESLQEVESLREHSLNVFEFKPHRPVVKVVVVDADSALILAVSKDIQLTTERESTTGTEQPILPIRSDDLGSRLWRLDFSERGPSLLYNNKVDESFVYGAEFRVTIMPAVIKEVLTHILIRYPATDFDDLQSNDEENDQAWYHQWLLYCMLDDRANLTNICNASYTDSSEKMDKILSEIDEAVETICSQSRSRDLIEKLISSMEGSE